MLLTQEIDFALSRAFVRAGRSIPARIAMIAITIKSSDQSENSCFHSGRKNRRTGKTIEQWNIRTFERRNKAGAV